MDPYLGEIRIFAGNYAPQNWAYCDGAAIAISQNEALYSLLSVTYGGNGTTSFVLPDLRSRTPIHYGQGTGQPAYALAATVGSESVPLTNATVPSHTHIWNVTTATATTNLPSGNLHGKMPSGTHFITTGSATATADAALGEVSTTGSDQPHPNMMPTLALTPIIATVGIYPTRP